MRKIEFGEIKIGNVARKHIQDCLDRNWITQGEKVVQLEEKWKGLFGYKYARAVSSGTMAGILACAALYDMGAKQGDEIICPALSFIATGNAIRAAGFRPRFVDVKLDLNIDEKQIEENINDKTVAIKVVNLMGTPARLDVISEIAKRHHLILIIDGCESYGCKYKGKYALEYGDIETSSFYTAHIIQSCEGSIISTNNEVLDEIFKSSRNHGRVGDSNEFEHVRFGLNGRMTDLHASIGLEYIEKFWEIFNKRRENIKYIRERLRGLEHVAWFTEEEEGNINCPHGMSITLKPDYANKIKEFRAFLNENGIHNKRNFGSMPEHPTFHYLGSPPKYPIATYFGNHGIHVGCHFWLNEEDLDYMSSKVVQFLSAL